MEAIALVRNIGGRQRNVADAAWRILMATATEHTDRPAYDQGEGWTAKAARGLPGGAHESRGQLGPECLDAATERVGATTAARTMHFIVLATDQMKLTFSEWPSTCAASYGGIRVGT